MLHDALPREIARRIVVEPSGCWRWMGAINKAGYGTSGSRCAKERLAHRIVYSILVGPIPAGKTLDHLCRVRPCVNPSHLEPVSQGENVLRGTGFAAVNASKDRCSAGHPFTLENTVRRPSRPSSRECRICWQMRNKRPRTRANGGK